VQAYGIPADSRNIIGHRELTHHTQHQDPNDQWDWSRLMAEVQQRLQAAGYVDYPIEGPPTLSRERFASVLAEPPASPVTDDAGRCYDLCLSYGVNPAVALAVFVKESNRGTLGLARQTLSWGNQRRAWRPERASSVAQTQWGPFAMYGSWEESLADWCELLLGDLYKDEGRTTVRSVLPKYAPAFENNTALYIAQTVQRVTAWQAEPAPEQGTLETPPAPPILGGGPGGPRQLVYKSPRPVDKSQVTQYNATYY